MSKIRKNYSNLAISNTIETKNLVNLKSKTGNLYEAISIIGRRANQINTDTKVELHNTLADFSNANDNMEEIQENKEQIEISKAYEKLPSPALSAIFEFENDRLFYKKNDEDDLYS
ncbi:MAG: DNA-directed RNA polymerase subunit omega [Sediminibacterium sp.]|nr:DNA-directed RNA polymerase subunit omega [Sediminibacterium sp.]